MGPAERGSAGSSWNHRTHRICHWVWKTPVSSEPHREETAPPSLPPCLPFAAASAGRSVAESFDPLPCFQVLDPITGWGWVNIAVFPSSFLPGGGGEVAFLPALVE